MSKKLMFNPSRCEQTPSIGMAVRGHLGNHPVFARGPRVPGQISLYFPGRGEQDRTAQCGSCSGSLDGRVA